MEYRFCRSYNCPINPPAHRTRAQYIIATTDYLTKWVEARATTKNDARTTACFLYECVFTRYGLPIEIISDRGSYFITEVVQYLHGYPQKISTISSTGKWTIRKFKQDSMHGSKEDCGKFTKGLGDET